MRASMMLALLLCVGCPAHPKAGRVTTQSEASVRGRVPSHRRNKDEKDASSQSENETPRTGSSSARTGSDHGCKLPSQAQFCRRNPEPSPTCDQACLIERYGIKEPAASEALEKCYGSSPCKTVTRLVPRVGNNRWGSAQRCVLRHMRDGTPGRYKINYFDENRFFEIELYITPSKKVVVLERMSVLNIPPVEGEMSQTRVPELCTLVAPSVFRKCLDQPSETCFLDEDENFDYSAWFRTCGLLRKIECPSHV